MTSFCKTCKTWGTAAKAKSMLAQGCTHLNTSAKKEEPTASCWMLRYTNTTSEQVLLLLLLAVAVATAPLFNHWFTTSSLGFTWLMQFIVRLAGIWSIDIADTYPSADVRCGRSLPLPPLVLCRLGHGCVRIANKQCLTGDWCRYCCNAAGVVSWRQHRYHLFRTAIAYHANRVPTNCHFELDDIEQPWTWDENMFDFIFARDLILAIRNWPALIDQVYRYVDATRQPVYIDLHCIV